MEMSHLLLLADWLNWKMEVWMTKLYTDCLEKIPVPGSVGPVLVWQRQKRQNKFDQLKSENFQIANEKK